MSDAIAAIVLCAGKGTRMKSSLPKVLHPVLGLPLASYPLRAALEAGASSTCVVVGHGADDVRAALDRGFPGALTYALQQEQRGTGDAVRVTRTLLAGHRGPILILCGDTPLLTGESLTRLVAVWRQERQALALMTFQAPNPTGYGRIVRTDGRLQRIVEERDCSPAERALTEVNAGIYCVDADFLWTALERLEPRNAQGEYYLTDIVLQAVLAGTVGTLRIEALEALGVNDRSQLAEAAQHLRRRILETHLRNGVSVQDPATTWVEPSVTLAPDVTLEPGVHLRGATRLATGCTIGAGSVLTDAVLAEGVHVKPYSVIEGAALGTGSDVGPFARLRPGTTLGAGVHIGNFVETKNAQLGDGVKAGHLSYLGDATIGARSNIGAGTITCNYDGEKKHRTVLGDGVFVGSDTQLVAPIQVGAGAYIGAGSTITHAVPPGALAVSRARQTTREGWVEFKKKLKG